MHTHSPDCDIYDRPPEGITKPCNCGFIVRIPALEKREAIRLSTDEPYERREDMSPDGKLQLFIQNDGDVIVQIVSRRDEEWRMASVEFCSCGSGGGRSPRVLGALRELARAIAADNEAAPFPEET